MNKIISLLYHPGGRIGLVIGMTAGLLVGLADLLYQLFGPEKETIHAPQQEVTHH